MNTKWYKFACTNTIASTDTNPCLQCTILSLPPYGSKGYRFPFRYFWSTKSKKICIDTIQISMVLAQQNLAVGCSRGAGAGGGGARGAIAPNLLSQWDGYACAPLPKIWQSLGISTLLPPKKKIVPAPRMLILSAREILYTGPLKVPGSAVVARTVQEFFSFLLNFSLFEAETD